MAGNNVVIAIPAITTILLTFDKARLYRRTGSRTATPTLIHTFDLVAEDTVYSYLDTTGTAVDWYCWTYYESVAPSESGYGEAFPANAAPSVTWLELLRRTQMELDAFRLPPRESVFPGPSGTTTAAGTTTSLVCSSYIDSRLSTRFSRDWFVRLLSGSAINNERRIASFDPATGAFTPTGAFSAAPGSPVDFDMFAWEPSAFWKDCLVRAARNVQVPFQFVFGGTAGQLEYRLPWFVQEESQVHSVDRLYGLEDAEQIRGAPVHVEFRNMEDGGACLYIPGGLAENALVDVRGTRQMGAYTADTDTVILSDNRQAMFVFSAAAEVLRRLMTRHGGSAEDRSNWERRYQAMEATRKGEANQSGLVRKVRRIRGTRMVDAGSDNAMDV